MGEMTITVNGERFVLWRAMDSDGLELNIFVQKRRIRFLSRVKLTVPMHT
ncbi:MAG: hypothetical protein ACO2ZM_09565 [Francisellaceae bacterium]